MSSENGSALAVIDTTTPDLTVSEYHRKATDAAGLVRAIVLGKAVNISGRKYVPVEAYQAIANTMGCVGSARDVRRIEGGYTAIGEVIRLSDGKVIASGEGFVGDDEPKWAKGPEYARRSFVQTRAIGRACRAAFAFIVPMIDLGLSSTPAEEMDGIATGTVEPPAPNVARGTAALKARMKAPPRAANASEGPPPHGDNDAPPDHGASQGVFQTSPPSHDRSFVFPFANKDQKQLHELSEKDLAWFRKTLATNIGDASKANFAASNRDRLALVEAELTFRSQS